MLVEHEEGFPVLGERVVGEVLVGLEGLGG